jgi:hypothetical protein
MQASSVAFLYGTGTSNFVVIGTDGIVKYVGRGYNEKALIDNLDTLTSLPGERPKIIPTAFRLEQNFPNPFNPSTRIDYEIKVSQPVHVDLTIYNVLGKKIRTLVSEQQKSGFHEITWDGRDQFNQSAPNGIYLYTLTTGERRETKRMMLVK